MKHRIRSVADHAAMWMGLLRWYERRMCRGLTILMYHRILPVHRCLRYPLASLAMPKNAFREQVHWLASHCDVLPVAEAFARLKRGPQRRTRPLVALTFDDGYWDNADIAAQVLDDCGVRGTFFVTTGFVESRSLLWFDRAATAWQRVSDEQRSMLFQQTYRNSAYTSNGTSNGHNVDMRDWMQALKRVPHHVRSSLVDSAASAAGNVDDAQHYRPMTVRQIRELHNAGHEIASHSVSHPIMTQLDRRHNEQELIQSRNAIRNWTGATPAGFAYPNGSADHSVERIVADTGYTYACTTSAGLNQHDTRRMRLARIDITCQRTLNTFLHHDEIAFRAELSGLRTWFRMPQVMSSQ